MVAPVEDPPELVEGQLMPGGFVTLRKAVLSFCL